MYLVILLGSMEVFTIKLLGKIHIASPSGRSLLKGEVVG
jgi:hypothetical protein